MTKYIEKQAATIDEAVQLALDELQMDRDSVSVEVLEKGKSGFFGIGAVPARVRVSYEESTPESEAKYFVDGLLQRMGIQGEAFPSVKEDGQIILDIRGEDKKHLTKKDLMDKFAQVAGYQMDSDETLLTKN